MDDIKLILAWIEWKDSLESKTGGKYNRAMLSKDMGVNQQYVSKLVRGERSIGSKALVRLCDAFNVSKSEFYAGPTGLREVKTEEIENDEDYRILGDHSENDLREKVIGDIQYMGKSELTKVAIITHKIREALDGLMSKKGA